MRSFPWIILHLFLHISSMSSILIAKILLGFWNLPADRYGLICWLTGRMIAASCLAHSKFAHLTGNRICITMVGSCYGKGPFINYGVGAATMGGQNIFYPSWGGGRGQTFSNPSGGGSNLFSHVFFNLPRAWEWSICKIKKWMYE